jgi:tRNA A-37 threonylcarbamoyl transferase component Bud32
LPKQVEAPSIIDEGEGWIEMELVEEEFFSEKLEKGEDPKQLGVEVGKIMNTFEDADLYLADWAIKDIYNADGKIGVTDLEFGGKNPNRLMRKMDRASVLLQTADSDNFKEFMEGLESEVALDYSTKILGFSMAFTYNLIYSWDEGRPAKVVRNGLKLHRET